MLASDAHKLGHEIAHAISRGLSAINWARTPEQMPRIDPVSGLLEDDLLIEALYNAIAAIPGVRTIG